MKQKPKRIAIKLNKALYEAFSSKASEKGITKSKLLREWILSHSSLTLKKIDSQSTPLIFSYNFALDGQLYVTLEKLCRENDVSKSFILRLIIKSNLEKEAISTKSTKGVEYGLRNIKKLWESGLFTEIKSSLEYSIETLNMAELLLLAQTNERLGKLDESSFVLSIFHNKRYGVEVEDDLTLKAYLINAQINIFKGNSVECYFNLKNALRISQNSTNRGLIGAVYFLLAELSRLKDDMSQTYTYYESALEYLDVLYHPSKIAEIYLRMGTFWTYQANFKESKRFLEKAKRILEKIDNKFYWGLYYNAVGINMSNLDSMWPAEAVFKTSIKINKNNIRETNYAYENLTRLAVINNRYDDAFQYIILGERSDQLFRPGSSISRVKLYRYFMESSYRYDASIKEIKKFLNPGTPFKPNLIKYILNSARYLNGVTPEEKKIGKIELKVLQNEGGFPLVKIAAKYTLENKRLRVVI